MTTTRERIPWMRLAALLLALLPGADLPAATSEPEPGPYRQTTITYLSGASVYLGAGSDDGMSIGQQLEVVRDGAVIGLLRVTYLSSNRALCERVSGETALLTGDIVRYIAQAPAPPPVPAAPAETGRPASRKPRRTDPGLHGRVGVRYLVVRDTGVDGEDGTDFAQPALDLRLDGTTLGGAPIDMDVDVRSRRSYRTMPDGTRETDGSTSVYRMSASWHDPQSPWRVTAGRQVSPSLAAISIFDGVEASYRASRWGAGVFSGTQPDPVDLGYSNTIREHGAYVEWRQAPESERRWAITTGLIGSYQEGEINREFSYMQGSYMGQRLSFWLAEEVDLNRGWKEQAEDSSVSFTSTLVTVGLRATEGLSFNAGYDNRRNVRLYRDRITPVTEFDDQYRTGAWVGATWRFADHYSIGLDGRTNTGGSSGGADGYTLRLGAVRLTPLGLDFRTRSTRYTNDVVEGWLHSLGIGLPLGSRWHVEINGGVRDETNLIDPTLGGTLTWYGLDVDVNIARRWFAILSVETSTGDMEATDQAFLSVAWRF